MERLDQVKYVKHLRETEVSVSVVSQLECINTSFQKYHLAKTMLICF